MGPRFSRASLLPFLHCEFATDLSVLTAYSEDSTYHTSRILIIFAPEAKKPNVCRPHTILCSVCMRNTLRRHNPLAPFREAERVRPAPATLGARCRRMLLASSQCVQIFGQLRSSIENSRGSSLPASNDTVSLAVWKDALLVPIRRSSLAPRARGDPPGVRRKEIRSSNDGIPPSKNYRSCIQHFVIGCKHESVQCICIRPAVLTRGLCRGDWTHSHRASLSAGLKGKTLCKMHLVAFASRQEYSQWLANAPTLTLTR